MGGEVVLSAKSIGKSYGGRKIIEGVDLELHKNELVCLLGVSGIGKSTLFNILSGLEKPDYGTVTLLGGDITGIPGKVSFMQQKDLLLPFYTVIDNVTLPLVIRGTRKKDARYQALKYFAQFGLEGEQDKYPLQMSGGQRQRAALLRTYLCGGAAALLDEPFSALDAFTKARIHNWYIHIMQEISLPTVFITHDIDEAVLLSDRIEIMSGKPGRIRASMMVGAPKPRDSSFTVTEEFLAIKRQILELLNEEPAPGQG